MGMFTQPARREALQREGEELEKGREREMERVWESSSVAWHVTPTQVNGFYFGRLDAFGRSSLAHVARSLALFPSSTSLSLSLPFARWQLFIRNGFLCLFGPRKRVYYDGMARQGRGLAKKEAELLAKQKKKTEKNYLWPLAAVLEYHVEQAALSNHNSSSNKNTNSHSIETHSLPIPILCIFFLFQFFRISFSVSISLSLSLPVESRNAS